MRIAIDIVSGDNPAGELLPGALRAAREVGARLFLVGPRAELEKVLPEHSGDVADIVDAPDVIGMSESPVRALRAKPDASVAVAASLVAAGEADIFLSPGNTGACLVVAARKIGNLPGVLRPALAACLEFGDRPVALLDVGAGAEAKPHHLAQFAVMGAAYAEGVLGIKRPRVGLMNNGTEPGKGGDLYRKAYPEIEKTGLNFIGNIEGFDLFSGRTDVAVTDGFTGNILVKSIAAATEAAVDRLGRRLGDGSEFEKAAAPLRHQAEQKGGIPLLGIRGGCLVMHGRAGAEDMAEAVRLAADMVRGGVGRIIAAKLESHGLSGRTS